MQFLVLGQFLVSFLQFGQVFNKTGGQLKQKARFGSTTLGF